MCFVPIPFSGSRNPNPMVFLVKFACFNMINLQQHIFITYFTFRLLWHQEFATRKRGNERGPAEQPTSLTSRHVRLSSSSPGEMRIPTGPRQSTQEFNKHCLQTRQRSGMRSNYTSFSDASKRVHVLRQRHENSTRSGIEARSQLITRSVQ